MCASLTLLYEPVRAETERKESGWTLGGATSRSSALSHGSKSKTVKSSTSSTSTSKGSKKKQKQDEGTLNGFLQRRG